MRDLRPAIEGTAIRDCDVRIAICDWRLAVEERRFANCAGIQRDRMFELRDSRRADRGFAIRDLVTSDSGDLGLGIGDVSMSCDFRFDRLTLETADAIIGHIDKSEITDHRS